MKKSSDITSSVSKPSPLVVIGTVAIDGIETPHGAKDRVFGGSASYFSYAASFFTPISLVAVVGEDFPEEYRAILKERPIDTSHLKTIPGKTFYWKGKYQGDMNVAETLETRLNVLLEFSPDLQFEVSPSYVFLANVDPLLQMKVLDQLHKPKLKFVACDTMNYWIQSKKSDLLNVLSRIDCIVLNDMEARMLTGESNLMLAAQKIKAMGPGRIVIKKGEHGGLLFYDHQFFALPAYPLEQVFDPTGAGDSFAGGLVGYLAATQDLSFDNFKRAMAYGAIVASFTVEKFGLEALRNTNKSAIDQRLNAFRKMTSF